MVFFYQLFDMLGGRAASTCFIHATASHQRHDGEHLGAGAEFHDGEQVREVIAQDVAGDRDGVHATDHALQGVTHGAHLRQMLDVETRGVMVFQI